jgi:tetratricopeptide (TPR) repeat protein
VAGNRKFPLYASLVFVLFVAGLAFDAMMLGSVLRIDGIAPFSDILENQAPEYVLLLVFSALLVYGLFSFIVYAFSLDPFRPDRPRALVYLNFLPLGFFVGMIYLLSVSGSRSVPDLLQLMIAAAIGFVFPLALLFSEVMLAGMAHRIGRRFDDAGWTGAAYFFLMSSLRWRPAVAETSRRCGLLLADMGRIRAAKDLLERAEGISASEDFDVLRVLEKAYLQENRGKEALKLLERRRALRPDIQALDQRYLEQCLALEEWDRAITMLESGAFDLDIEGLCRLHELYLKTGNVAQAMARARQVAEMEEPPYPRAIALYSELLHRIPDNVELMIDLGALLQSTKIPSQMERGASYFEAALKLDPKRRHLHRRLAAYYQDSVQFEEAQEHFQELYESGDPDPETYLRYAALLKDLGNVKGAIKILLHLQELIPEDWRGFRDCAAMLLESGDLDEAETMLDRAQALAADDEKAELNQLRKRFSEAKEERFLQVLAERASRGGAELSERLALIEHLIAMDKGDRAIIECDSLLEEHPEALFKVQRLIESGARKMERAFRLKDYLADLYFRQARYDEMLELFKEMAPQALDPDQVLEEGCRKILSRAPEHLASRVVLGDVYMRAGNWEGVLRNYERVMADLSTDLALEIRFQCIQAARRAGRLDDAERLAIEVFKRMSDDRDFLVEVIELFEEKGEPAKAYEVFKIAIQRFPADARLQAMERTIAEKERRGRLASLDALEKKSGLTERQHFEKAELHRQFGESQEAIVHYQRAADEPALHDLAIAKLAVCLCERRMFDLADETLDRIVLTKEIARKHPEMRNLIYRVADALEVEDMRPAALKYFKRLFQVDASFRDVVARIESLDGSP